MIDFNKKIKNSEKFRAPAIFFQKHGLYCFSPYGTTEYLTYWDTEAIRCVEGYTAPDGDWISGYNYFYLNYCPILRLVEFEYKDRFGNMKMRREKARKFPDFYDYDYYYFMGVQEAQEEGAHMAVLKARGKGFSFKGGSMLDRNYYLIPDSKGYAIASETEYLVRDGLLTKAWDYMDFIDEHTAWAKKRQAINTKMHRKASIITTDEMGNKIEVGYKSEIIGVSLKNDPNKARGKRGQLILWEEAGSFKDILQAWQIARPSVEEDGKAYGLMIAFGTGGDEGSRFDGLKEMFYNPSGYNIKSFPNIWDEGADANQCAFFVPVYANMSVLDENGHRMFMDKNGNSLKTKAVDYAMTERKKVVDGSSDSRAIDRYIAENPITPQEAVLELTGNIFPKKELMVQLASIRTNKKLQAYKQVGDLNYVNGILSWEIKQKGDITKYPLGRDDKHEGSIVIWEHPSQDTSGQLYIAGCLLPGEQVITDYGLKNVEDVSFEDKLINEDGLEKSIVNLQRYEKVDEPIFKVKPNGSFRTTTFTQEHPILLDSGFKKASELKKGDVLKIPNRYIDSNNNYIDIISKYFTEDFNYNDPLFWWFLGIWIGDGFNNKNSQSHDIYVAFGIKQIEEANFYKNVVYSLFHRKTLVCVKNGGNTTRFTYKILYDFLENEFGRYSYGKRIPEWVKYAPEELKKYFISGYLDSDGSAYFDKGKLRVSFTSINLTLLESIQDILYSMKIRNSIVRHSKEGISIFNNKEYKHKESYKVSIPTSEIKKILPLDLSILNSRKINEIEKYSSSLPRNTVEKAVVYFVNKYIFLKIENIAESKYTGTVYNFECDTHTYMCRNIVTHNCDPLTN